MSLLSTVTSATASSALNYIAQSNETSVSSSLTFGGSSVATDVVTVSFTDGTMTTGNGTANGLLRLYDRFDALGTQMMLGPVIRICGTVAAYLLHGTLTAYVAIRTFAGNNPGLWTPQ